MMTEYITHEKLREILETLEGKNINFLIGAGASMPYLQSLDLGNDISFEDLYEASKKDESKQKVYEYLSACFLYNSIIKGTYEKIHEKQAENDECKKIARKYQSFIKNIYSILRRNSIQQPKRANIFTTNYDMFFEYSFDEIGKNNNNVYFNDGSYGFINKTVSVDRFHIKVTNVGVDSRFEREMPMINLMKLHGSLNWKSDNDKIILSNKPLLDETSFNVNQVNEILNIKSFIADTVDDSLLNIKNSIREDYSEFVNILNELSIVKPSKNKFSETVLEEQYYQMLRIFIQEMERNQSVLIAFGFSFEDEHIRSILKRSLSNPNLLVYIICFDEKAANKYIGYFGEFENVKLIMNALEDQTKKVGDFSFLNKILGGNN